MFIISEWIIENIYGSPYPIVVDCYLGPCTYLNYVTRREEIFSSSEDWLTNTESNSWCRSPGLKWIIISRPLSAKFCRLLVTPNTQLQLKWKFKPSIFSLFIFSPLSTQLSSYPHNRKWKISPTWNKSFTLKAVTSTSYSHFIEYTYMYICRVCHL